MWIKYIFDRVVSLVGLLLIWPLLLVVVLMIRRSMPGAPAIFKQQRVGKDGRLFTMYKFRTMVPHHSGSSVSVAGEDRITPLGKTLRRYKLDELPELWNILIGDMSFVGLRYADCLEGEDREILNLRPGITGPASLKYRDEEELLAKVEDPIAYNNEVIYPDKVRLNRYYYHHYSFVMDIRMIFATVLGKKILYNNEWI